MPEFSTTFPFTVENVYKHPLADLEGYLQGIYEFKAFRIPAKGEIVLTSQYTIEKVVFQYDVPRLIVGDKPRRVVFEEVRQEGIVAEGEFWQSYDGSLLRAITSRHKTINLPIFRKVEDSADVK